MPSDPDATARRRFVQLLGAGAALGVGTSSTAAADDRDRDGYERDETQAETDHDDAERPSTHSDSGLVTLESDADFETTVSRVGPALEERGLTLVATVDHAANATTVDEDLPPTMLFLFGNPAVGTPLMQASRSTAIDLPQKLLVWAADGDGYVTYNDPDHLAARHDLEGVDEQLTGVEEALADLAAAVASGGAGADG
ncbi:DUF302 domain-containing protein [Halopiger goleimassiliensis]|uniref:DUF302 domain-containing protein n=1 Tax=Halopiger goleimassiliensis TaxID=1293048 RepID=UPI000677C46B|nr:DUF302 domain-containing protein [Halopiger goleimassiliensis]